MPSQTHWSPAALLAGIAGLALTAYGLTRRAPLACVLGTVGLGLIAGGVFDAEVSGRLGSPAGKGAGRQKPRLPEDFFASRM